MRLASNVNGGCRRIMVLLASLLLIVAVGCGGKTDTSSAKPNPSAAPPPPKIGVQAAILPNADLVAEVNFSAIQSTPIFKAMEAKNDARTAGGEPPLLLALIKAAGLSRSDFQRILFSLKGEGVDLEKPLDKQLSKIEFVLGASLSKKVTLDNLKAGLIAASMGSHKETGDQKIITVAGYSILKFVPPKEDQPGYFGLSQDGQVIFFTMHLESLTSTLDREKARNAEALSAELAAVKAGIQKDNNASLVMVLPDQVRQKIQDKIRKQEEAAKTGTAEQKGASANMQSFYSIKNLALGLTFADKLNLALSATLGSDADAKQGSAFLTTMLPMMAAMTTGAKGEKGAPPDLFKRIQVDNKASVITVSITLEEKDLQN